MNAKVSTTDNEEYTAYGNYQRRFPAICMRLKKDVPATNRTSKLKRGSRYAFPLVNSTYGKRAESMKNS